MSTPLKILMVTTNWPSPGGPRTSHFIKRQADFLKAAGVEVDVFHFQARKNLLSYLKAWLSVRRKLRSRRYDLIHAQFGQSGLMALPKRIPYVVTLRGSDILGTVSDRTGGYTFAGTIKRDSRYVAEKADAVNILSAHIRVQLNGAKGSRVIPSGIDFNLFRCIPRDEARRRLGLPLDERLVLFVGNPQQARKRYELAKQAVDLMGNRAHGHPNLHVSLRRARVHVDAGGFPERSEGSARLRFASGVRCRRRRGTTDRRDRRL